MRTRKDPFKDPLGYAAQTVIEAVDRASTTGPTEGVFTIVGVFKDNLQGFMTAAEGVTPEEAVAAARASVEDEYARGQLKVLAVLRGNLLELEAPFAEVQ